MPLIKAHNNDTLFCIAVCLCCAIALQTCAFNAPDTDYLTEKLSRGTITATCTANGTLNPLTTVLVGTQVSGRIKDLYVDFNAPVQRGQLIAEIDPAAFEAQLEQARANLLSAKANLEQAEASFQDAERDIRRKRELYASGIIGDSELDAVVTSHHIAKSRVAVAGAQVAQTKAAYTYAETNLRYTKIYAPIDGIVISKDVDVGQTVTATFQTPTLYSIAEDMRKMQINTNVDEADIGRIQIDQTAEFTVDAYPDLVFSGRVVQIRNSPIIVQSVVSYDVVIRVDNPELKLKPGMTATVAIIVAVKENVLRVPNAALRFMPNDQQGCAASPQQRSVWTTANPDTRCVPIQVGIDDHTYTEVVSGELSVGDNVIVGYAATGTLRD